MDAPNGTINSFEVSTPGRSIFSRAVKGGFWLFSLRILTRLIDLAKSVIVLRLLEPSDFGLVGIATLTMGMMISFTEMGLRAALVQRKENTEGHLNVAWTFGIVRGILLFGILYFGAPYVADFFNRADAEWVIRLVAISILLRSFANIGTVYFAKELQFHKQFIQNIISLLAGAAVAILLAFKYRNVWALVFGGLAASLTQCVMSYVMHPYRPRISFDIAKAKDLWAFSKHVLGASMLDFFCLHGDDAFLGKMLGATALGFYQQAYRIGNMVAAEIGNKVAAVAFPAYSKLQDNLAKLRAGYFKAVQATSLLVFPIAGGIIILAHEFTEIVLGAKWLPMVPAMQILCMLGLLKCMQRAPVFMSCGRPDIITRLTFWRFLLMLITIYPLTVMWGMVGTSICVLGASLAIQPLGFYKLQKLIDAKFKDVLKLLSFPFAATLIMMACVFVAKRAVGTVGLVLLALLVGLGAVIYFVLILLAGKISKQYDVITLVHDVAKALK